MVACPAALAAMPSIPVPTIGDSGLIKGTDWRNIFVPMDALVLSSCSRNGIKAVEIERICLGDISMWVTSLESAMRGSPACLADTRECKNSPSSFVRVLACAAVMRLSWSASTQITLPVAYALTGISFRFSFLRMETTLFAVVFLSTTSPSRAITLLPSRIVSPIIRPKSASAFIFTVCETSRYGVSKKPYSLTLA